MIIHECYYCGEDVTEGGYFFINQNRMATYFCNKEECILKALDASKEESKSLLAKLWFSWVEKDRII